MTLTSDQETNEAKETESQKQIQNVVNNNETPNPDNPKDKETIGRVKRSPAPYSTF